MKRHISGMVASLLAGVGVIWAQDPFLSQRHEESSSTALVQETVEILPTLTARVALASLTVAENQTPVAETQQPAADAQKPAEVSHLPVMNFQSVEDAQSRFWADAEYLLWWFKAAPAPVPLVTTGSLNDSVPGAIGQPGTQVLFGGQPLNSPARSGYRLTLGGWVNDCKTVGVEVTGFYFQPGADVEFSKSSNAAGLPLLGVPFFDRTPAGFNPGAGGWSGNAYQTGGPNTQAALLAANGTSLFGNVNVHASSELWGMELNSVINLLSTEQFKLNALVGFRFIDLRESLGLDFASFPVGIPVSEPFRAVTINDLFRTRNEFYGGQLGLRGEWTGKWLFASVGGKIALGGTNEVVDISGSFTDPLPFIYRSFGSTSAFSPSTGIFAQPTNSGTFVQNHFAVAGDVDVRVGVNVLRCMRVFVGYEFLGLSSVVRPGNQMDRNINTTQVGPAPGGASSTLTGQASPTQLFNTSTFFAQGVNFGVEFRY
jgi:Putative beta barrel porin-7 (BBP7)